MALNDFVAMVDAKAPKAFHTFLIECVKPAPTKGRIGLNSADPTEPPLIDMQLFGADADVTRVAKGIELVRQIMSHRTIQQYGPEEVLPGFGYKATDQIKDYLRKYSSFGHQMSGTAKMGKPTDPMAVVDSHLEVIGVEGLRVCDTSVFPEIPAYNTSRPAYLVGEVLADMMTK